MLFSYRKGVGYVKITPAQKIEICKLFYSGEKSKSELAKSFNVSHTAISKILNDEKVSKSFKNLSEELTNESALSMIAFMESKTGKAQELISGIMEGLQSTLIAKIQKSSLKDCVISIGELSKIFTFSGDGEKSGKEALNEIVSAIKGASEK